MISQKSKVNETRIHDAELMRTPPEINRPKSVMSIPIDIFREA